MTKRKWDPQNKATIVLQGLKGRPVADICTELQTERREQALARENVRLKQIIVDLTVE